MGDPEEISISRLLSKSYISVIDEDRCTCFFEGIGEFFCLFEMISDDDKVMCIWRNALWPDESLFISKFLCDYPHETRNPDTVAPHDEVFGLSVFVLIFESKCIRKS